MFEGTIIDPAIRKQLTRQYREWNNARSKIQGEPCLERRIARTGDRRGIETRYFSVGER